MKIKSISVKNFKAISEQELNLNGASAIISAGNNKGKTSLLRGLIDRFKGERPEIIVKEGEEKGISEMELTDGSKIGWSFTKKTENFYFTTPEEIKITTGVLSAIGEKYFGLKFSIEKFLQSNTKEQMSQVQKLLGIDLTEIENKYKAKYEERTDANREVKRLLAIDKKKPEEVDVPDIEALKKEKAELEAKNQEIKEQWKQDNEEFQKETIEFNEAQDKLSNAIQFSDAAVVQLDKFKGSILGSFIKYNELYEFVDNIKRPKQKKEVKSLEEPKYEDISVIDKKIEEAYDKKSESDAYQAQLDSYNKWVKEGKEAREKADKLNEEIDKILEEKKDLIKKAKLPKEFEMTDDGLLYNGFPLSENQISSSGKYIAALKLGALSLGKIKTLHFDASYLDKNSLSEIQKWADDNDFQLLIERPDYEGGDIKYHLTEEVR